MKVILSRKGFDESAGGDASPILPDGTLLSLPIPDDDDASPVGYADLKLPSGMTYLELMRQLPIAGVSNITDAWRAHVDPDLRWHKPDNPNWVPAFGQANERKSYVLSHLINQKVGDGDLFLYYGWFRQTKENPDGTIVYDKCAPNLHVIWGYLQVGEVINVDGNEADPKLAWLKEHPHLYNSEYNRANRKKNRVFVARKRLSFNESLPGAGCFQFDKSLVLTLSGHSRSHWTLRDFFDRLGMSGHRQEHVIQDQLEAEDWAKHLIETNICRNV